MTAIKQRALEQQATVLLRRHGFTWSGRSRQAVDFAQMVFEHKKIISAGHCGKSTRR